MTNTAIQDTPPAQEPAYTHPAPPAVYAALREDLLGMDVGHPQVIFWPWYLLMIPAFLTMFLHRVSASWSQKGTIGKHAARFLWRLNVFVSACDIMTGARIGPKLSFPHPMGIVIGESVIGRNATILHNVTIGKRKLGAPHHPTSYPVIGDNVTIMAGAVICGPVKIGDHALIGANAVVLNDVPAHAVVAGAPARILSTGNHN